MAQGAVQSFSLYVLISRIRCRETRRLPECKKDARLARILLQHLTQTTLSIVVILVSQRIFNRRKVTHERRLFAASLDIHLGLRTLRSPARLTRRERTLHRLCILSRTLRFTHRIKRRNHVRKEVREIEARTLDPFQLIREVKRKHRAFLILFSQTRDRFILDRFHFSLRRLRNRRFISLSLRGSETRARVTRKRFEPARLLITRVSSCHQRSAYIQKHIRTDLCAGFFLFYQKLFDLFTPQRDVFVETQNEGVDDVLEVSAPQFRRNRIGSFRHHCVVIVTDDAKVDRTTRREQIRQNQKPAFLFAIRISLLLTLVRRILYFHSLRRSRQWPCVKISEQRLDHLSGWITQSIAFGLVGAHVIDHLLVDA